MRFRDQDARGALASIAAVPEWDASIAICSKNRRDDLRAAIQSALSQEGRNEVLVWDDASTDGTSAMVEEEFPEVRLWRSEESLGPTGGRNRLFEAARAPIVVSLDDDAVFLGPDVVRETLADFAEPRVGGVAIPMIDRPRLRIVHAAPAPDGVYATLDHFAAACAYRRDVFFRAGGFTESFRRQVEEADVAERMLRLGYVMRCGTGQGLVDHQESLRRESPDWIWWQQQRNEVVLTWRSAPGPYLPARMIKLAVDAVRLGLSVNRLRVFVRGFAAGVAAAVRGGDRRPLPPGLYRVVARMRSTAVPLSELEPLLPPVEPQGVGHGVAVGS